ncbi:hypothetical protein AB6A40_009011 [Gnathostoma spinigerum]|uniref:Sushi domain-containing protein n=1 Tax=Gnathostoma spinigerum TaxID=75299 RepID=A0ABD6ET45_9BILA
MKTHVYSLYQNFFWKRNFIGVLVYVNNVERGQPEIYVVLEEAQIGIRIRESYAIDIDRLSNYQESMGMLDVTLSVPPQYGVRPDGDKTREQDLRQRHHLPRVSGLMRPFPDQTSASFLMGLTLNDVNSEAYRQQIINNYRIPGTGEPGSDQNMAGTVNQYMPTDNMFTTSKDEDKKFEVFPEASMKSGPIYKTAEKYDTGRYRFVPRTGQMLNQVLQTCRDLQQSQITNLQPYQSSLNEQYGINQCPDNPSQIIQECGDSVSCLYDYTMLNARVLGMEAQNTWNTFTFERSLASRQYNSCGPINIEYPEYMMKTPSLSSGYLQGDVARFDCFQTHWIKGDSEYKCSLVVDYYNPNEYRFEWNKGSQPWCRSRVKDNLFKWLAAIFATIGIIMAIVFIFICCWAVKVKKRQELDETYKASLRGSTPSEKRGLLGSKKGSLLTGRNGRSVRERYPSPPNMAGDYRARNDITPSGGDSESPQTSEIRTTVRRPDQQSPSDSALLGLNTSV